MKFLTRAVFAASWLVVSVLALATLALKGNPTLVVRIWSVCAATAVCSFAARLVMLRSDRPEVRQWADALKPSRLGAAIVAGVATLIALGLAYVHFSR